MAEYSLIIAVVLAVVISVAAYKLIHGAFKLAMLAVAIASVVLGIAAFLVIMDANDLKENFGKEKNLVVVVDEGRAVFAMELRGENDPRIVNRQEVDEYSVNIAADDYEVMRGKYYRLIIVDTMIADGDTGDGSDDFFTDLVEKAFADPIFFIEEYKKGNIQVYEETALFKAVKYVPVALVKSTTNRIITKAKVVVADKIEG